MQNSNTQQNHQQSTRWITRMLAVACAVLLMAAALPLYVSADSGSLFEGWRQNEGSSTTYDSSTHAITLDASSGRQQLFLNLDTAEGSSEENLEQFGPDIMTDYEIQFDLKCNTAGVFAVAVMGVDPDRLYWNAMNAIIDANNIGIMYRGYWYIEGQPAFVDQWGYASGISSYHDLYGTYNFLTHHVTVTKSGYNVTITVDTMRWTGSGWENGTFSQTAELPDDIGLPNGGYIGLLADSGVNVTISNMKITNKTEGFEAYDEFFTAPSADFGGVYEGWRHISASGNPDDYISYDENTKALTLNGLEANQYLYLNRNEIDDMNSSMFNTRAFNANTMTDFVMEFDIQFAEGSAFSVAVMGANPNQLDGSSITARVDSSNFGIMWRGYSNVATPANIASNWYYASGITQWHNLFSTYSFLDNNHFTVTKSGSTVTMTIDTVVWNDAWVPVTYTQTATLPDDIGLPEGGYVGLLVEGARVVVKNLTVTNTTTGKSNGFFGAAHTELANYSEVNNLVKTVKKTKLSNYTDDSVAALNNAVAGVDYILGEGEQATVDGYAADINDAIGALQFKGADYTALNALLDDISGLDLSVYTDESVATLQGVIDGINFDLTIVDQDTVNGYVQSINDAVNALEVKPVEPAGEFAFDDEGALRYFVDGEPQYAGVVEYENNLYYINSTLQAVRGRDNYYVTVTNDRVPAGYYDFDENGVMTRSAGTPISANLNLDPDGMIRYYESDIAVYAGLVDDGNGNYYYIGSGLTAITGRTYYITKTNGLLPAATYMFGEDGRIQINTVGNNICIDADGIIRYIVDGEAQYAGVVQDGEGNYYYIGSGLTAITGRTYYITKTNGLLPAANYTFGEDGKIQINTLGDNLYVDADGIIRYVVDGEAQYAGVVQDGDGNFYYINSAKKAVTATEYFITKTNELLPAGLYNIGADGVIEIALD